MCHKHQRSQILGAERHGAHWAYSTLAKEVAHGLGPHRLGDNVTLGAIVAIRFQFVEEPLWSPGPGCRRAGR